MTTVPLNSLGLVSPTPAVCRPDPGAAATGVFAELVDRYLGEAAALDAAADDAVTRLATGQISDIHEVTIAAAKADLMFRFGLEVRNRLTDAYQEIARMTI